MQKDLFVKICFNFKHVDVSMQKEKFHENDFEFFIVDFKQLFEFERMMINVTFNDTQFEI